jgi:hypothetical protein
MSALLVDWTKRSKGSEKALWELYRTGSRLGIRWTSSDVTDEAFQAMLRRPVYHRTVTRVDEHFEVTWDCWVDRDHTVSATQVGWSPAVASLRAYIETQEIIAA